MILINKEEFYTDDNGIKTPYKSPIDRWKEMIGYKDPTNAKQSGPNSLRALYGTSIVKNEFWGSDSSTDAFRELTIFMFPLPAKVL
jgi:nucleoside diphosphate kinase